MQINRTLITVFALALVGIMVSGSATSGNAATIQKLPTCTDPTGHNLPCMIVISTLPPPPNPLQCQETSGQILACSYTTQNLSNGEQIVVITVYVPANFVFSSPTVIKVIVREATTTSTTGGVTGGGKTVLHKLLVAIGIAIDPIVRGNTQAISVTVSDRKIPSKKIPGAEVNGEVDYASHKTTKTFSGITDSTGQMSYSWQIGGNSDNGTFTVKAKASKNGYVEGFATKTFRVICKSATECGHMILNQTNSTIPNNMTNTTSTHPTNTTVAPSGESGAGATCVNNCTTGTAPPVDCTKNPNDPSCTQTLTPSITTPTTKTCPDGSVIDASATCPTQSTPSPTNPPPSTDNNPPSADNNSTPPSDNNHNDNGNQPSSNSDKGGDTSNGGDKSSSDKGGSQPTTTS